jgi:hypothetical protein
MLPLCVFIDFQSLLDRFGVAPACACAGGLTPRCAKTEYEVRNAPPPRNNYIAALVTKVRAVFTWVFGSDSTLLS